MTLSDIDYVNYLLETLAHKELPEVYKQDIIDIILQKLIHKGGDNV